MGDGDAKENSGDISLPTPVDSENDEAQKEENSNGMDDLHHVVVAEEQKDETQKKNSLSQEGDENFELVENQLKPPPNLRLLKRQESEIEIE